MVLDALKKRLHDTVNTKGSKWIKELPNALWGLRTQPTKPTGQSPYFLVYGSEAILPGLWMLQVFLRTLLVVQGTPKDYSSRPSRLLETILLDYKVLGGLSYGPP
jgi:hypothetical protein